MKIFFNSIFVLALVLISYKVGNHVDRVYQNPFDKNPAYSIAPQKLDEFINNNSPQLSNYNFFVEPNWTLINSSEVLPVNTSQFKKWQFNPSAEYGMQLDDLIARFNFIHPDQYVEFEFKPDGGIGYALRVSKDNASIYEVPSELERNLQIDLDLPLVAYNTPVTLKFDSHMSVLNTEAGPLVLGVADLGNRKLIINTNYDLSENDEIRIITNFNSEQLVFTNPGVN